MCRRLSVSDVLRVACYVLLVTCEVLHVTCYLLLVTCEV